LESNEYSHTSELVDGFHSALRGDSNQLFKTDHEGDSVLRFAQSVARGLSDRPRWLDCQFLYDERGSALYEDITRQPEYYPTRTEAAILSRYASELPEITGPVTLIELGSGSSVKTDHILCAYLEDDDQVCYVPIDVSESALLEAAYAINRRHPDAQVIGVNSTYEDAFPLMSPASPTMVVFLGSTIGNLNEEESDRFWTKASEFLPEGDFFLLGVDLVKDSKVIHAAYNDASGVTEAFTRNLFTRMNRELGSNIAVNTVDHLASFHTERQRVEIFARFNQPTIIRVDPVDASFHIKAGVRIMTEISRKFRLGELVPYLSDYGFRTIKIMTDPREWFALLLLQRSAR
jgi:L-histidine Nalpha-methyltransferase